MAGQEEPALPVQHRERSGQALLLPARLLAHPPGGGLELEEDGRLVPAQRAGWVDTCFQSYGRDVSGAATRNPEAMKSFCAQGRSGEKECIYGAVRDIATTTPTIRAASFCELVKTEVSRALLLRHRHDPRHAARRPGGKARGLREVRPWQGPHRPGRRRGELGGYFEGDMAPVGNDVLYLPVGYLALELGSGR